jgi:hypothetical protein
VKYVLKISSDDKKHDYYSVGFYDTDTDTYEPASPRLDTGIGLRYDYGKFYASKSFFDPSTSRRILLGWSNESDSIQADISKGWSSIQVKKVMMFLVHRLNATLKHMIKCGPHNSLSTNIDWLAITGWQLERVFLKRKEETL